jgi:hypothetical protein
MLSPARRWVSARTSRFFLLFTLVQTATSAVAARPRAPELLPANTLVYVRITSSQELVERFNETAMGRILKQDQVAPLVQQLFGVTSEAFKPAEEEIGVSLTDLLSIPQGEIVFALVTPSDGPPALAILVDVGDSRPVVEKLIERGETEMANDDWTRSTEEIAGQELVVHRRDRNDGETLAYFFRDETFVATSNLSVATGLLDLWAGGENGDGDAAGVLADNEKFKTIMNRCRGSKDARPQLTWFVDPIQLARVAVRGNIAAQASLAVLPVLGLDGIEGVGGSLAMATENFDMIGHMHLMLDTPRSGIVEMVALRPGDTTPEPWVPQDVASYMTLNWDIDLTYDTVAKLYDSFRGEGRLSRDVQGTISEQIGADFEKDILRALEGRATVLTWFEPPAALQSRARLVGMKLNDAGEFQKTMDKIVAKFPKAFEKKQYANISYYALDTSVMQQRRRARRQRPGQDEQPAPENLEPAPSRTQPCMGIVGDYLMIADRPSFIEKIVAAKSESGKSLASDLEYKLIAGKIRRQPGGTYASMVTFNRPEAAMRMMYDLATSEGTQSQLAAVAADNDFLSGVDKAMRDNPLPPFAVIQKFLAPGGGMITDDETGIHYMGFALRRE